MSEHESGQVAVSAAEIYEQFFVPALFVDWPPRVLDASDVKSGDRVLDVACGTGMLRVVRPGGKIGVAVWASLEATPGYTVVAEILTELFGPEMARSIEAPYSLGDTNVLKSLFAEAGADEATVQTVAGKARFSSIESWIYTDIKGWTLADVIDDEGYERLKREAPKKLSQFVLPDGTVEFDAPAHIVTMASRQNY